ncbi:hypothetical protein [Chryseobacterium sp. Leaf394]|uniref:hypothetical protein n=1 Tax=Chryseobacterium sp. Leaf394 TaxID=1736361 RepID=UPI0006F2847C|nr:hypothetical protein [Chryseobacterium sp. Leaf394]KQS92850.1 hypothetical protein ASG21_10560 [Chryseobacterium sp. Leaf394]
MTSYFDLHLHPIFKNHICNYDETLPKVTKSIKDYTQPIRMTNVITNVLDDLLLHILKSQCSVTQCDKGNLKFAVAGICNLEYGFADSKGLFGGILKSNFSNPLDKKYFDRVRNGEVSYYRLMLMELSVFRFLHDQNVINFASRNSPKRNNGKMEICFSLEGSHNISKYLVGNASKLDFEKDRVIDEESGKLLSQDDLWKELVPANNGNCGNSDPYRNTDPDCLPHHSQNPAENFEYFYHSLSKSGMDLFYLTVTHLTHIKEQVLATHAFGIKMLKHPSFFPFGNGFTNLGYQMLQKCFTMTNHLGEARPVLIDIKHLGLKSRQDLYEWRKKFLITKFPKGTTDYTKIPLIASHIGVTGYSVNEWKNALETDKCKVYHYNGARAVSVETKRKPSGKWGSAINNDFSFNPWSINLMDEDIIEILKSGGILGVSLDVRILGFQSKVGLNMAGDEEYLSTPDFQTHFPQISVKNLRTETMESMMEQESWLVPTKEERHPLVFCFNIIHIIQVGIVRVGMSEPWKNICIGSDFDGLIEPLKICPDAASLDELEANLHKWLLIAEKSYVEQNGGKAVLADKPQKEINKIITGIMGQNGIDFSEKWKNNFQ